jgi:hypothetical protein
MCALLIDEALYANTVAGVEYTVLQGRDVAERCQRPSVAKIYDGIMNWPPNLVAVVTCDLFPNSRTRRRGDSKIWKERVIEERILACYYPKYTQEEAKEVARLYVAGDEETQLWVDNVLGFDDDKYSIPSDGRQGSITRVFKHIKPNMAHYWRTCAEYKRCRSSLRDLLKQLLKEESVV